MSRPSWHRQAGLEAAVSAVRPDLDHEVRVDMMLGIALAVPGHHIPPIMSLGGLAARRTSSSAHRVSTSYKCAKAGQASRSSRAALCCASWTGTRPQVSAVSPTTEPGHAVPCWLGIAALTVRSAGSRHFVLKTLQFKTLWPTQACTIPAGRSVPLCRPKGVRPSPTCR